MPTEFITLPPSAAIAHASHELAEAARAGKETARESAINKATMQLAHGCSPLATFGAFLVESRTSPGVIYRVSHQHGCGCPAGVKGIPCWHTALIEIIEKANSRRVTMPATLPPPRRYSAAQVEKAQADIDELFAR